MILPVIGAVRCFTWNIVPSPSAYRKETIMNNAKAYAMVEERFSAHVKAFNTYDVSAADSDMHYWTVKDRLSLASAALERAPEIVVTTLARSLGDVYREIRAHLTPEELTQWEATNETLERLADKYEN